MEVAMCATEQVSRIVERRIWKILATSWYVLGLEAAGHEAHARSSWDCGRATAQVGVTLDLHVRDGAKN